MGPLVEWLNLKVSITSREKGNAVSSLCHKRTAPESSHNCSCETHVLPAIQLDLGSFRLHFSGKLRARSKIVSRCSSLREYLWANMADRHLGPRECPKAAYQKSSRSSQLQTLFSSPDFRSPYVNDVATLLRALFGLRETATAAYIIHLCGVFD